MDIIAKRNHELVVDPTTLMPMCIICNVTFESVEEMEAHLNGTDQTTVKECNDYDRAMKGVI